MLFMVINHPATHEILRCGVPEQRKSRKKRCRIKRFPQVTAGNRAEGPRQRCAGSGWCPKNAQPRAGHRAIGKHFAAQQRRAARARNRHFKRLQHHLARVVAGRKYRRAQSRRGRAAAAPGKNQKTASRRPSYPGNRRCPHRQHRSQPRQARPGPRESAPRGICRAGRFAHRRRLRDRHRVLRPLRFRLFRRRPRERSSRNCNCCCLGWPRKRCCCTTTPCASRRNRVIPRAGGKPAGFQRTVVPVGKGLSIAYRG